MNEHELSDAQIEKIAVAANNATGASLLPTHWLPAAAFAPPASPSEPAIAARPPYVGAAASPAKTPADWIGPIPSRRGLLVKQVPAD